MVNLLWLSSVCFFIFYAHRHIVAHVVCNLRLILQQCTSLVLAVSGSEKILVLIALLLLTPKAPGGVLGFSIDLIVGACTTDVRSHADRG